MPRLTAEMGELINTLQRVLTDRPAATTSGSQETIPRYIVDSLDFWDPARPDCPTIRDYLDVFDDFTLDLSNRQRVILLRMKLRGGAQTFLVDHPELRNSPDPYNAIKTGLIAWFDREDLDSVMRKLMTARLGETEGLREFAERVRRLSRDTVRKEFSGLAPLQQGAAAAERARTAFIKGLPPSLSRPLLATAPPTLETALRRAEEMRTVGLEQVGDPEEWRISTLRSSEPRRCFLCRDLGHLAAYCPQRNNSRYRDPSPGAGSRIRDRGPNRPSRPCIFCKGMEHYPADCPDIPECQLCGLKGHEKQECERVILGKRQEKIPEPHPNSLERTTVVPQRAPVVRDQTLNLSHSYLASLRQEQPEETEEESQASEGLQTDNRNWTTLNEDAPMEEIISATTEGVELAFPAAPASKQKDELLEVVLRNLPTSTTKSTGLIRVAASIQGRQETMLIDTGAQASVLTTPIPDLALLPATTRVSGVDGHPIPILGTQKAEVVLLGQKLKHRFLILTPEANGTNLLGMDMLRKIPLTIHTSMGAVYVRDRSEDSCHHKLEDWHGTNLQVITEEDLEDDEPIQATEKYKPPEDLTGRREDLERKLAHLSGTEVQHEIRDITGRDQTVHVCWMKPAFVKEMRDGAGYILHPLPQAVAKLHPQNNGTSDLLPKTTKEWYQIPSEPPDPPPPPDTEASLPKIAGTGSLGRTLRNYSRVDYQALHTGRRPTVRVDTQSPSRTAESEVATPVTEESYSHPLK